MTEPRRRPNGLAVLLLSLLLVTAAGAQNNLRFRTIGVLPAINETGNKRIIIWQLGWQYLIQERIRELPGLEVRRLELAPDLITQYQAGKLDPTTIAVRNQVAEALGAELLIAPVITGEGENWTLTADLLEPATGPKPVASFGPFTGAASLAVVDQLVTAVLKEALKVPEVTLPDHAVADADEREIASAVASVWLWPFSSPEHAKLGQLDKAAPVLARYVGKPSQLWLTYQRTLETARAAGAAKDLVSQMQRWATIRQTRDPLANLLMGQALLANGDAATAKAWLIRAADQSKGSLASIRALAECYKKLGQIDEALGNYEQASKLWPNVRPLKLDRAELALSTGRLDIAIKAFQSAINLGPDKVDAYIGMCDALNQANRGAEALPFARQWVTLKPDELAAKTALGKAALAAADAELAKSMATEVLAKQAEDPAATLLLGQALYQLMDYDAAAAALDKATKLDAKNVGAWKLLAEALVYKAEPDWANANKALAAAIKAAPDVERPELMLLQGRFLFWNQKYEPAAKVVGEAAALLPMSAEARYLLGDIQLYGNKAADAMAAYAQALQLDPGAAGQGQRQIAYFEQEEAEGRAFDNGKLVLGYLYQACGRNRDARKKYNEYLSSGSAAELGDWVRERIAELDAAGNG